jgi:hypothetical protein
VSSYLESNIRASSKEISSVSWKIEQNRAKSKKEEKEVKIKTKTKAMTRHKRKMLLVWERITFVFSLAENATQNETNNT